MSNTATESTASLPTVAIVGRPNVGKSALFNRIVGRRISIVHEESGVTRDRVVAMARWKGRRFQLVDTGGLGLFEGQSGEMWDELIRQQLAVALESADHIIFVGDCQTGATALDEEVARLLRAHNQPVTLAINKADNDELAAQGDELLSLGFERSIAISCVHRRNIDDLLDLVTEGFAQSDEEEEEEPLKVAIVGRPNVGKSTLTNQLLGEERVIVSDIAGTTRDAIDVPVVLDCHGRSLPVTLIDTAGIKRKRNLKSSVEFFSLDRAETAIERCDLAIVVIDSTSGVTNMDKRICRLVLDAGKAAILLANKWDLAGQDMRQRELIENIRHDLGFMAFAPLICICAQSGYNLRHLPAKIASMNDQMRQRIPTALLNQVIQDIVARTPPPSAAGGVCRFFYAVYTSGTPPTFRIFVNRAKHLRTSYSRFLEKQLRIAFGLSDLPIHIELRERRSGEGREPRRSTGRPRKKRP
jgi:GTP-binding protein